MAARTGETCLRQPVNRVRSSRPALGRASPSMSSRSASNEKGHSMRSKILALVALLLVATGPAIAGGGGKGDTELGVYGGYGWLDDYGIFHPKNGPLYGARLGYFFSPL